jgi:hypothetical protein
MTPILLFDPRREHSFVPITKSCHRRDAGTVKAGRIFAATPWGLGLDWPEYGGMLAWRGLKAPPDGEFQTGGFRPFLRRC